MTIVIALTVNTVVVVLDIVQLDFVQASHITILYDCGRGKAHVDKPLSLFSSPIGEINIVHGSVTKSVASRSVL